jgi:hypothetical protein
MTIDSKSKLVAISYWSGELPENTLLHFLSFRSHNPNVRYFLFLESDSGFHGSIPAELRVKLSELNIEIKNLALSDLMDANKIPKFSCWRENRIFKFGKLLSIQLSPFLAKIFTSSNLFYKSALKGTTLSHVVPFTGFKYDLAYRADLFRSLAISLFPDNDFLYLDLDICILKKLDISMWETGAIAQWGTDDFGNSAFLYLPCSANVAREQIISSLQAGLSALPWVLYSKHRIQNYKLNIIPNRLLDPAWNPNSIIAGRAELFFRSGEHVEE